MGIEENALQRLKELVAAGEQLRRGDQYGHAHSNQHDQQCRGWIASIENISHLLISAPQNPYRQQIGKIASQDFGYASPDAVGAIVEIAANMVRDLENGLIASIADVVRAEAFDDFLDHAQSYLEEGAQSVAGVISGVVFEDTIRQICRRQDIGENNVKLDQLISELAKNGSISAIKAKRARAAAALRTSATHARWEEFQRSDVEETIRITRELISTHLES